MHLLEQLSLAGFRSIKEMDDFRFGPITALVGANGSGKSNLILFSRLMNHVMQGQRTETFIERFPDKVRVFHFHDTSMTSRMRNYCEENEVELVRPPRRSPQNSN